MEKIKEEVMQMPGLTKTRAAAKQGARLNKKSIWKDKVSWQLLILCIPALAGYILFNYYPMIPSMVIPFKEYKMSKGIWGSPWDTDFSNFKWIFTSKVMLQVLSNTVLYGAWFLVVGPVTNMILALFLFEVTNRKALKFYQTVFSFPNFMSFVIVGYITYAIIGPKNGVLNAIITAFGGEPIDLYMEPGAWPLILTIVNVWKGVGMGSMMYFASLMGIDTSLYEAAEIDGAGRFQKMRYISLPHLIPLVCIFSIMGVGSLVSGNFDLYYIIPRQSSAVYTTTEVMSTYIYTALKESKYAWGSAVGLLQSIVGLGLVVGSNAVIRKISPENSLF